MNKVRQGQDTQDRKDGKDKRQGQDRQDGKDIQDRKITELILKSSFEVVNELGAGFLESVYKNSLAYSLQEKGLSIATEQPFEVHFKGNKVGFFVADLIVEEKILIELKCVNTLLPEHLAQTINYLKATDLLFGMLINFGRGKLEYRRLFHPDYNLL